MEEAKSVISIDPNLARTSISALLLLVPLAACSCSENRPESPEFFQQMTGLPICSEAKIENASSSPFEDETDYIYSVNIEMNENCARNFFADIHERLGHNCAENSGCSFVDNNGWDYEIRRIQEGRYTLVLVTT